MTKRFRIQLLVAGIVLICGVALMGLVYLFFNKPEVYVSPGIVSNSPSLNSVQLNTSSSPSRMTIYSRIKPYYPPQYPPRRPEAPMTSMHIWTTSSQTTHDVGGGFSWGLYATNHTSPSRGITTATGNTMPMGTFAALASSRPMAQPEAQEAPMMAQLSVAPKRAPGPPNVDDLTEEHQLYLGDGHCFLLLLAFLYLCVRFMRRRLCQLFLKGTLV